MTHIGFGAEAFTACPAATPFFFFFARPFALAFALAGPEIPDDAVPLEPESVCAMTGSSETNTKAPKNARVNTVAVKNRRMRITSFSFLE